MERSGAAQRDGELCGSNGGAAASELAAAMAVDEPIVGVFALSFKTPGTLRHSVVS